MDIIFDSPKLQKELTNRKQVFKRHGAIRAKKIRKRLDDLKAATVLEDMRNLPGRCHELKGDRANTSELWKSPFHVIPAQAGIYDLGY